MKKKTTTKKTKCMAFLLCINPATTTFDHPIVGKVPCCDRCAAKRKELEALS
jgi:hypothetical protein